jgi:hypothetical protein
VSPGTRLASLLVVCAFALAVATQVPASAPGRAEAEGTAGTSANRGAVGRSTRAAGAPVVSARCNERRGRGCRPRSRIVKTNHGYSCRRPLERIARRHGRGLPLLIKIRFTRHANISPGVVEIRHGCRGDGNSNTIDLILEIHGDGRTKGGTSDAIKVREDPHDIQITGFANCGPRNAIGHQDGAQIMGGNTIEFIDFRWGKWKKRRATCQGAAGTFVPGSLNGWPVRNIACIRCRSVSCNHGMSIGPSVGNVVRNSRWRSDNPRDRRGRLATGLRGLCDFGGPPCVIQPGQSSGNHITRQHCDRWPYRRHF